VASIFLLLYFCHGINPAEPPSSEIAQNACMTVAASLKCASPLYAPRDRKLGPVI